MYFKSGFIALLAPAFIFSNSKANSFAALSSAALVAPFAKPTPSYPVSVKDDPTLRKKLTNCSVPNKLVTPDFGFCVPSGGTGG